MPSLRSRVAGRTPASLRKAVRMTEHYFRRHRDWINILKEMHGMSARDTAWLLASACSAPLTSLLQLDGFRAPRILRDLRLRTQAGAFRLRAGTDDIIRAVIQFERNAL